jgi:hypothetical protein
MLDERTLVSHTLGKMLNESVVLYFKALSQHLPGWREENHEKPLSR